MIGVLELVGSGLMPADATEIVNTAYPNPESDILIHAALPCPESVKHEESK